MFLFVLLFKQTICHQEYEQKRDVTKGGKDWDSKTVVFMVWSQSLNKKTVRRPSKNLNIG